MSTDRHVRARRHLLGELSEEDATALEGEYFTEPDAVADMEAVEESLIEDHLANRLTSAERDRFDRYYLSTPEHRTRVDTIRRLRAAARPAAAPVPIAPTRFASMWGLRWTVIRPLALAAGLVVAIVGAVWILQQPNGGTSEGGNTPQQPAGTDRSVVPPAQGQALPYLLSPLAIRSSVESPALIVPAGTDAVDLQLAGMGNDTPIARARVVIRTVAGDDIWRGDAASDGAPAGLIARVRVPADRLRVDDYVVTLIEVDGRGGESERYRYSLRVRPR